MNNHLKNIIIYRNRLISGKTFNDAFYTDLYKVSNNHKYLNISNSMEYKFYNKYNIHDIFEIENINICRIIIPNDAKVFVKSKYFKCNKFVLLTKISHSDFLNLCSNKK